jgi:hypothetical protein
LARWVPELRGEAFDREGFPTFLFLRVLPCAFGLALPAVAGFCGVANDGLAHTFHCCLAWRVGRACVAAPSGRAAGVLVAGFFVGCRAPACFWVDALTGLARNVSKTTISLICNFMVFQLAAAPRRWPRLGAAPSWPRLGPRLLGALAVRCLLAAPWAALLAPGDSRDFGSLRCLVAPLAAALGCLWGHSPSTHRHYPTVLRIGRHFVNLMPWLPCCSTSCLPTPLRSRRRARRVRR